MDVATDACEPYFEAVRADDLDKVRRLLTQHPDWVHARWRGRGGQDGKMRSLLANPHAWSPCPAPAGSRDPRFTSTPLIYTRNDEMVRLLVDMGADVNAKGTSGDYETPHSFYTPLWRAAHDGRLASIKALVENGVDVNYFNPDGRNQALATAAENGAPAEVIDYLLSHGARPDIITAAMLGLADEVEFLLKTDRWSAHARDEHGRSPLDGATLLDTFRVKSTRFGEGHDRAARALIEAGANVEIEHAASLGMFDRVRQIIGRDAGVLTRPRELKSLLGGTAVTESALQAARRRGRQDVVAFLVECGAPEEPRVNFT